MRPETTSSGNRKEGGEGARSMSRATDLQRELDALEPELDKIRAALERDAYGSGDDRDRAQKALDKGTSYLAEQRAHLTELLAAEAQSEARGGPIPGQRREGGGALRKELAEEHGGPEE